MSFSLRSLTSSLLNSTRQASPTATALRTLFVLVAALALAHFAAPRQLTPSSFFSTTSAAMSSISKVSWADAVSSRRSIYALSASSPIPDSRIVELVQESVKHTPTSFNSQSSRAVVVFGDSHLFVWDAVKEAIKAVVPDEEAWKKSEQRLDGFRGAYGTVLLFEDSKVVQGLQEKLPLYKDKFPEWSHHAHGALAVNIWTALEAEGLGANLQHYNPLIDAKIEAEFKIPSTWLLTAQLVFGKKEGEPFPKEFQPVEERVKVFGAKQ